jgi:hypothetical protein
MAPATVVFLVLLVLSVSINGRDLIKRSVSRVPAVVHRRKESSR